MIEEHPDLPATRVAYVARREWMVDVNTVDHLPLGTRRWHWVLGDDDGPRWLATVEPVNTPAARAARIAAHEAAAAVGQTLPFAVAPVHTRDARIAVDVRVGALLTLTPYVEGTAYGDGPLANDEERCMAARLMGDLHHRTRPRLFPMWRPQLGRDDADRRGDLERCLADDTWSGGPWSGPASGLVHEAAPVVRQALRRFTLLGAAVAGTPQRWVVTHGDPSAANLVRTPDGTRLLDWGQVAIAPRERDLWDALGGAEGSEPWFAYLESGGRPDPLSPDTLELFALQRHLGVVAELSARFSGEHDDTEDDRRLFGDLEAELGVLVSGWA